MKHWTLTILASLIAITPALAQEKIAFISTRSGDADVFSMSPDGSGQTNLTNTPGIIEELPSWSADGSRLVYNRTDDVWTMNADGSNQVRTPVGHMPNNAAFRTNSTLLSYSRFGGTDYDIYSIQPNGTGETLLVNNPLGDYYARWAPNGTKFTYHSFGAPNQSDIYLANPDGSGQTKMTTSGNNSCASWHPDGGQIVFQSSRDGNNEIYVMNVYGTVQTRLTNNSSSDTTPVFSPDGSKIAFVSNRDGNNEIYVMNADGTNQTRLTNDAGNDNNPTWQQTLTPNAPSVQINDVYAAEGNSGTNAAIFTLTLSAASTTPVNVSYRTYDGTAHAGSDYTSVPLTSVTFSPGQTSKTITIPVTPDTRDEPDETFSVRIAAVGATITKQQGVATVQDDDPTPSLTVNDQNIYEGSSGTFNTNITVSLSAYSGRPVSFQYSTANSTAIDSSDYTAKTGTVTIPEGQLTGTISIPINGDQTLENNESFFVNISNPVNATIADAQGVVTLNNDDTLATLSINDLTVAEGGNATFTINLTSARPSPVTVNYATANGTAIAGSDYTATSGVATIPAGQISTTVTVPTINDTQLENSENFVVNLTQPTNANIGKSQGVATITSEDTPEVSISSVSLREGHSNQRGMIFTVSLSDPAPFGVLVTFATANGTALSNSDYSDTAGAVNFIPGQMTQSFAVPILGDKIVEGNETFFINLTSTANGVTVTTQAQGTIVNDDVATVAPSLKKSSIEAR